MIATELEELEAGLPRIAEFADVADASMYLPLPDGWLVGTADVVDSTGAIAAGRYKSVNMVGASVVAAVRNALQTSHLPFVFGGDGAAFVAPQSAAAPTTAALAAVSRWATDEIGLELRTALTPIGEIRAAGHDVRLARFAASPSVSYTMFTGGGVAWAEQRMKEGQNAILPAPSGAQPNLEGLSCRWQPIRPQRDMIASLLVLRRPEAEAGSYRTLVRDIVDYIQRREIEEGRPVSFRTMKFALSPRAIGLEARVLGGSGLYALRWLKLAAFHVLVRWIFRFGIRVGGFDPVKYRHETVRNTDFRKFDDGLKLTIDCSSETFDGLRTMLEAARRCGVADFGLHAQNTALMTCIVPAPDIDDHIHFVDGADGGYAKAAEMLKVQRAAQDQPFGT